MNRIQAVQHFKAASEVGHIDALFEYGRCVMYGRGVKKNLSYGLKLLRRAATVGSVNDADLELAAISETAKGFRYQSRALYHLRKVADFKHRRDLESKFRVASYFVRGTPGRMSFTHKEYLTALKMIRKANSEQDQNVVFEDSAVLSPFQLSTPLRTWVERTTRISSLKRRISGAPSLLQAKLRRCWKFSETDDASGGMLSVLDREYNAHGLDGILEDLPVLELTSTPMPTSNNALQRRASLRTDAPPPDHRDDSCNRYYPKLRRPGEASRDVQNGRNSVSVQDYDDEHTYDEGWKTLKDVTLSKSGVSNFPAERLAAAVVAYLVDYDGKKGEEFRKMNKSLSTYFEGNLIRGAILVHAEEEDVQDIIREMINAISGDGEDGCLRGKRHSITVLLSTLVETIRKDEGQ